MSRPKGHKTKVVRLRADQLKVHPEVQRNKVSAHQKRMIDEFDIDALGVLTAVQYPIDGDSGPWVIDGQHRLNALMHHGFGEWICDVKIDLDVTNDAGAAALFLKLNSTSKACTYDAYIQELIAGKKISQDIDRIAKKHHLKIGRSKADGTLVCIHALKKLYAVDYGSSLDSTLALILNAWGSRSAATDGALIAGIGLVYERFGDNLDIAVLTKKLAKFPGGPSGLIGDASGLKHHRKTSLPRCVAEIVIEAYNHGRRANKLDSL